MDGQEILQLLDQRDIAYHVLSQPNDVVKCQNIFIKTRDSKHYYLLMLSENKKIDLQKTKAELHSSSLTFTTESKLEEKLQVKSGAASPFSLLNDATNTIPLIVDQAAMEENNLVSVHLNDNTKTISLSWTDLARALSSTGHLFEERSL